jgi:hypothetical protein
MDKVLWTVSWDIDKSNWYNYYIDYTNGKRIEIDRDLYNILLDVRKVISPNLNDLRDEIELMITNAYGEEFLGKWSYNKKEKQFDCASDDYKIHSISPKFEHIKNLWTLNLDERIKVLTYFKLLSEAE